MSVFLRTMRLRMWKPGFWFFLRIAMPLGRRDGEYYDIHYDATTNGSHLHGFMAEFGWRRGDKKPFRASCRWVTPLPLETLW